MIGRWVSGHRTRTSIRGRLFVGLFAVSVITMLLAGTLLRHRFDKHLLAHFDHSLHDKARLLRGACSFENGEIGLSFSEDYLARIDDPKDPEFFLIRQISNGRVVLRSANMQSAELELPEVHDSGFGEMPDDHGVKLRYLTEIFSPGEESDVPLMQLLVGHRLSRIEVDHRQVDRILWQVGLAITAILLLSISWVLRRNLEPLFRLQEQIENADPESPTVFETAPNHPAEVASITRRLNKLMVRVEESIRIEREFSGMAAHELRTPLAGIRAIAEQGLPDSRFSEILQIESDLEVLVENLLLLTRIRSEAIPISNELVRPSRILAQSWGRFFQRAESAEISFKLNPPQDELPMLLPSHFLRIVFLNVLGNAVEYTRPGGAITAEVCVLEGGKLRFVFRNSPIQTKLPEDLQLLTEPFRRGRSSEETETMGHSGLGLTTCLRITTLLGGGIEIERDGKDGIVVVIEILSGDNDREVRLAGCEIE